MLRPSPPPPHPYMRIACMHMTESVSFSSCLINNTVLCHSTLLCANFTPLCATLRLFTPLCATLLYLGRPRENTKNTHQKHILNSIIVRLINVYKYSLLKTYCVILDFHIYLYILPHALADILGRYVWNNQSTFNPMSLLASIKNKLKERFISFWKQRMLGDKTNKKLRTYKLLKQNFGNETYLEIIDDKIIRKCLSSFRISAHKLRIERGRYVRPREDLEKRLCLTCNTIEDEIHFICKCKKI